MSENKGLVKVDKHVKIVLAVNAQYHSGELRVDFDLKLHRRGSDFSVYASTGYVENTRDTDLLAAIINAVMTVRSGVSRVDVKDFRLGIYSNSASDVDDIMKQLQYAAIRAGYHVEYIDRSSKY